MPNSFLGGIRMANMFRVPRTYDYINDDDGRSGEGTSRVSQIGRQVANQQSQLPVNTQPAMNVVYKSNSEPGTEILRQSSVRASPELELEREKIAATAGLRQQDIGIRQQRADVYQFKAQNPNMRVLVGKDGMTRAVNPITGEIQELGQTGLSDEEAAKLNQTYQMERIEGRGNIQRELQETRGRQEMEQINERARSGIGSSRGLLPAQEAQQYQNKYNILINQRPELREFIELDFNGMPIVAPSRGPLTIFGREMTGPRGPTEEQRREINEFIFGNSAGPSVTTPTITNPTMETGIGTVKMRTPDGREIDIPANQVDEAKKRDAIIISTSSKMSKIKPMTSSPRFTAEQVRR
jgi:hypothetical protein